MFKKMASDALELSDIGKIIDPEDFNKTDADECVRHEEDEQIYFLVRTKMDEYCFINLADIHVDWREGWFFKTCFEGLSIY